MKKITITLSIVLLTAVLTTFAFADPGWSTGPRYSNHRPADRPYHQYDQRDYRDHWRQNHQPVFVSRAPIFSPRPFVRIYETQAPSFRLSFPHFSISIR